MKKKIFGTMLGLMVILTAGCSNDKVAQTDIPPLHYSQNAPDLIDVCRFDALSFADDPATFNLPAAVDKAGETLGAALDNDSRTRVLVKKKAAPGEKQIYTDNYLIQVATPTGIKTVMARLGNTYESELFALDEAAVHALPFRFMAIPNGESMVHICMVDPVSYLSQFTDVSDAVEAKLQAAVNHFIGIIGNAFPDAHFDPQKALTPPPIPQNYTPIVELGQAPGTLDTVCNLLKDGNLYYNNIAFKSGIDAFGDNNGADGPEDIFILYEDPATRPGVEIRGFVPFNTFKDFRKGSTFDLKNMTDTMAYLVQHSIIHIFDGDDRRQAYDVNGETVYQLLIFDGHVDPMLIMKGVSHFASVPLSVFLMETNGLVTVKMQNQVFKFLRYYDDLTPEMLAAMQDNWNAFDPPAKLLWPDLTVEEFGEFSMNVAQQVFDAAVRN